MVLCAWIRIYLQIPWIPYYWNGDYCLRNTLQIPRLLNTYFMALITKSLDVDCNLHNFWKIAVVITYNQIIFLFKYTQIHSYLLPWITCNSWRRDIVLYLASGCDACFAQYSRQVKQLFTISEIDWFIPGQYKTLRALLWHFSTPKCTTWISPAFLFLACVEWLFSFLSGRKNSHNSAHHKYSSTQILPMDICTSRLEIQTLFGPLVLLTVHPFQFDVEFLGFSRQTLINLSLACLHIHLPQLLRMFEDSLLFQICAW